MNLIDLWKEVGRVLASGAPLFRFAHGLSFFVLGMAISFAAPRAVRLEVGRRLPLLALFAFCEAATTWDGVLAPALGMEAIIPPLLRVILLGIGYGALLGFGLLAQAPPGRRAHRRQSVLTLLLALWLTGTVFAAQSSGANRPVYWAELVARYGMALPGGLLALWSMRRHSYPSIDPQVLKLISGSRRIAGVGLGAFGLLAGLILPSVSLFRLITHSTDQMTLPLLAVVSSLSTACGIAITYGLTRTLNVIQSEVERWIEGVEKSQALAADRERIGRELHDGIIQFIYAAGLMLEGVRHLIREDPDAAEAQLSRVMRSLNQTIQDIRRYIFDLRGEAPEADLVNGLEEVLRDFRVNTLLETELIVKGEDARPLGVEQRRHIFQVVREALSNVARHAQARRVEVRLAYMPDVLQLQVADDGVGLAMIPTATGQGLRNIRERARLLEGTLDIDSAPGRGVTLTVTVPYS
jgi:signal transduction histidine kinase